MRGSGIDWKWVLGLTGLWPGLLFCVVGQLGSVGFGVVAMWWPSGQQLCEWVSICCAVTGVAGVAGLCYPDKVMINALHLGTFQGLSRLSDGLPGDFPPGKRGRP
ncbi:hypothetical protein GCM10010129_44920 [Streptomyces fumigatiscleroticus]|nr:hypothetical protein GCM10010129_44920 [Streptomyces fumigatiscleroticus]